MKLKPLGTRLVIEKVEAEEKTASGIVLPSSAQEQPQFAKVVAVGADITDNDKIKDAVQVGDKVIYSKYSGTEVKLDGKEYILVKFADVLAVLED